MDITDWQLWLDLFSPSDRRPGLFLNYLWNPYGLITQTPIVLGILVLALTFLRPRRWVSLPANSARCGLLTRLGVLGPIFLAAVATISGILVAVFPLFTHSDRVSGAWFRAVIPFTVVAMLGLTALVLSRERPPGVGNRAILPRRVWHAFAPRVMLSIMGVLVALYIASEVWQAAVGSEPRELRSALGGNRILKSVAGAPPTAMGWENHGASILGILLATAMLLWLLRQDASRPIPAHASLTEVKSERIMTARLVCQVTLGGVLLALGMAWLHTWAPTYEYMELQDDAMGGKGGDMIISHYHGLVRVLRTLGWAIQGLGTGLLLRLTVDTLRADRVAKHAVAIPIEPSTPQQSADSQVGAEQ